MSDGNGSAVGASVMLPAAPGTAASIAATQSAIATGLPPRLKTCAPVGRAPAREDQRPRDVLRVLEQRAAAERDPERHAEHGRGDRHGRAARHPLVAPGAVDGHRPQADARHARCRASRSGALPSLASL